MADMPNNPDAPVDDPTYAAKCDHLASRASDVHVTLYAGIGPGTRPLSAPVPYKAYMGPSVGDLFFSTLAELDETLAHYRGCSVSFHCEDPELLEVHATAETHEKRRPNECEVSATRFALEMIEKLSRSERLKLVFVRHAFRYWMGRNERINDAPVLQDAYKAYEESGGSMQALLISLLTSDSFLYRTRS